MCGLYEGKCYVVIFGIILEYIFMLIGEKFIYFELQKTGCSYTRNVLNQLPTVNSYVHGNHNTYMDLPSELTDTFTSKVKVGNIRNPWDWYVSLWAFGCMGKGSVYYNVIQRCKRKIAEGKKWKAVIPKPYIKNMGMWEEVYANAYSPELFRAWLKLMLEDSAPIGADYKKSPISEHAGLLTYRYLKLYSYDGEQQVAQLKNFQKIQQFDTENNFIDVTIKNEHIHKDLLYNASKIGLPIEELQAVLDKFSDKTNTSSRKPYPFYYDEETKYLVEKKERLIIEKYGYEYR